MSTYLEFEKPIAELETKVSELRKLAEATPGMNVADEAARLETRAAQLLKETYAKLTPWQKTQVARHTDRPHSLDYIAALIEDLDARGLLHDVVVYCAGEFGRTPLINGNAGRDHWSNCFSVLFAGGGLLQGLGIRDAAAAVVHVDQRGRLAGEQVAAVHRPQGGEHDE